MRELLGIEPRRTHMRLLGLVLLLPLMLVGCGDVDESADAPSAEPSGSVFVCSKDVGPITLARPDLDGDGTIDSFDYSTPADDCPGGLSSDVEGLEEAPTVDWTGEPSAADTRVISIPGRTGDVVLVLDQHPRGGFQAHLYGYAAGTLEELTVDGAPVFPFVATDVLTDPLSARCTDDGFEITQARAHEPIGVVPAWDIDRTTYTVHGNTVTAGPTTEVADNVLDEQLHHDHRDLVRYSLFTNCRADR